MEVGIGKGVRDPKGHAVARHECNISFLLLFMVSVKLQIIYLKYFIPIAWGIFWAYHSKSQLGPRTITFPERNGDPNNAETHTIS